MNCHKRYNCALIDSLNEIINLQKNRIKALNDKIKELEKSRRNERPRAISIRTKKVHQEIILN